MEECPPGVVGEIVIRGEQVLKGYFRNEEGTRKAFEGGWFHTGDMARRDEEGFFYIVDRMKDMIITGGENVYSREVEEVLYTHPSVAEAAVVGLPDPKWGENVTAVIVLREGTTATEAEIIATARDRLAGFKKPKRVIFVDELPKTVSGKIIKRELRDRLRRRVHGGLITDACPATHRLAARPGAARRRRARSRSRRGRRAGSAAPASATPTSTCSTSSRPG